MSTGRAANSVGPNSYISSDVGINWGTDPDLDALFSNTSNATVLEFDFVPATNYMSFEYVFASEEYQEGNANTCVYSDVFAFLIKRIGDPSYANIAVIPNSSEPVSVTTVHPLIPGGCAAVNESYFGTWNANIAPINFNGQTAVLTAESTVIVGETYHIKLVIADHTNSLYDSAVFLKAGSFNIGTDLGIDRLRTTANAFCGTETLDCGIVGAASYTWYRDDVPYDVFVPIAGANNQTLNITTEGKYKVVVDLGGGCLSEGEVIIEYGVIPLVFNTDLTSCNDDGTIFSAFDFTDTDSITTNGDASLIVEGYYHTTNDATNEINKITNFTNYTNTMQDEEIFVRIKGMDGCTNIAKITLKVFNNPKIKADETMYYCLNTYPDTITLEGGIINDNPLNYQYKWFFSNGVDPIVDLNLSTANIAINQVGNYSVEITSADNCTVTRNITVLESNVATITDILISDIVYSNRVSLIVNVTGIGNYSYALDNFDFQDSNVFDGVLYGYHVVTVRDKNGCMPDTQETVIVLEYPKFLSPNNDGNYDTWNINNINTSVKFNTISKITIYDRYGKIMKIIDANSQGWDGTYNHVLAPPADYWFRVDLIDYKGKITTKKGHFSLVR